MNEQRSASQATNHSSGKAGVLAAAAVIAGGTQTYSDPVRFDNVGGQFVWKDQYLDITRPHNLQPNTPGPSTIIHYVELSSHPYYYPPNPLIKMWPGGAATLARREHYGMFLQTWATSWVSRGTTVNGSMDFSGSNVRSSWRPIWFAGSNLSGVIRLRCKNFGRVVCPVAPRVWVFETPG